MLNDVKSLYVWYPFLPTTSIADNNIKNIKDAYIILNLEPFDISKETVGRWRLKLVLDSINKTSSSTYYASFLCNIPGKSETSTIHVPILIGVDSVPSASCFFELSANALTGTGYIIAEKEPVFTTSSPNKITFNTTTVGSVYILNPSCLYIRQKPPKLTIKTRYNITKEDSATSGTCIPISLDTIKIADEYNVSVAENVSDIILTGADGGGLGYITTTPFTDVTEYEWTIREGIGLKSINGLTDAAAIVGYGSVAVTTTNDAATKTLTITINNKEAIE